MRRLDGSVAASSMLLVACVPLESPGAHFSFSAGRERMSATTGCKCRECFGLAEYMLERTQKDYGLPRASGCQSQAILRVLTTEKYPDRLVALPSDPDPCTGGYDCDCRVCVKDRASRVRSGVREPRQPWQARRAA